ncbi:HNH endonuclease signature motif containing protein [Streptomyces hirsutus]|uniref:HNH endonuclease signature motif containing protein n=1 Tax=Streptomyces hirsutus TaxID=35620 RepID=UPI00331C9253
MLLRKRSERRPQVAIGRWWKNLGLDRALAWQKKVASNRRQRSARARTAVVLRSGGRCENPGCASPEFREVTEDGKALLEVDHVNDLAFGGEDHPLNMVALCPNCHAVKTRGRNAEPLREVLARVARERHSAAWKS